MKAVIMAGGEGTRLRPLTSNAPKPMMPVANRPMMEHVIGLLREHGVTQIVVTVAFLGNMIRTYFGDGSEFGVRIAYAAEETPLGTAGSVRNAMDELDERFLVISGDVLTDIDLASVIAFHDERGATATLALKAMENPLDFGIVITREDGAIERFLEKPSWGQVFSDTINTGIYVLEPEVFDFIPAGQPVDFSEEVFPALLAAGKPIYGSVVEGYWEDVGTIEAYLRAHRDVLDGRVDIDIPGFRLEEGVWLGEGAEVHPAARVSGPAIIGGYTVVEAGARLGEYSVVGSNTYVGPDVWIERSVVHDSAYLADGVRLRGAIVGRGCDLRNGARCEEGVVLGDECFVGEHAVLNPEVKVYPFKTVEPGATVNSSIVWESRGARSLFGRQGLAGLANVDLTPELAVRVAMAYGTTLKKGAVVTTSRDSSRAARALKRAVIVGLNATGVNVQDLEVATVPLTRFNVRSQQGQGGVTVRLDPNDPASVSIRFFGPEGLDLAEPAQRKIERLYYREDFRRALGPDIGDIGFPGRALDAYTDTLMSTIDVKAIAGARFKIVLDYAYGSASFVMPSVLAKLGADVLAVNPYAATAAAAAFDRRAHAARVADLVRASGAHLGAVLDPGGECITFIDDAGHVLTDDEAIHALLVLVDASETTDAVALPVAVSRTVEEFCRSEGITIEWTKLSTPHLMEVAAESEVGFAASQQGGFIFPDFLPAYDGVAALVHTLDMLTRAGVALSTVTARIPPVHIAHEQVVTPWEQKGTVMRTLLEQTKDEQIVIVDGLKVVREDGWALVLPDPEDPLTHVWAEGSSDRAARDLALEYARNIRQTLH